MAETAIKKRDVAIDLLKVFATLLVLNPHMRVCYGSHSSLATGGAIGDALFFFISGYTLFLGRKGDFLNWYKRRIGRIYPTVLALGLVACLIFQQENSFIQVMSVERYWFLQCILVCYILLYPVIRYGWKLSICIPVSIVVMLIAYFTLFDFGNSLFYGVNNYFRWIVYLSVMLVGGGIFDIREKIKFHWWSIPAMLVCIIAWYGITFVAKGHDWIIASYFALIGVCYFFYESCKAPIVEKMFDKKILGNVLFIIGNLCLESYLIQKYIFTDAINNLFPLNIPIIMIAVLIAAYLLHMLSTVIEQIFDSKPFDWNALLLYKK